MCLAAAAVAVAEICQTLLSTIFGAGRGVESLANKARSVVLSLVLGLN